jgi:L-alanine-DL-glutamate epimerase-like enolase superfamily enzyme
MGTANENDERIAGSRVLRLALDLLRHDLRGKEAGLPVWKLLSAPNPAGSIATRSLGIPDDLKEFSEQVKSAAIQFRRLKLKLGSGNMDFDEAIVATAREVAPHAVLFVDVNGGWSVEEAIAMLRRIERFSLEFIEQPVHHSGGVEFWRALQAGFTSRTIPLYADESVQNVCDLRGMVGLIQGVNIKLLKTGGFKGALDLINEARAYGMKTLLGCMVESSIGVTAAAHLAGACDWVDLDGHLYLAQDDFEGVFFNKEGLLEMPLRPGIGARKRGSAVFS